MKSTHWTALAVVVFLLAYGCSRGPEPARAPVVDPAKLKMFAPLPEVIPARAGTLEDARVTLGRMLFFDPRLSKSQSVSCNSCHLLDAYGVDNEPTSGGHKGQRGDRNSPTVYNAAGHFAQFWDGRARDVEEQAKGPVLNPLEMAMPSEKRVVAVLKSMPEYVQAFRRAFPADPDPVSCQNMAAAIGAFERGLLTPARWDKFLKGDHAALSPAEKAGFGTFLDAGCATCHSGPYLGGHVFQKLGLAKDYPETQDPGRFRLTKNEADHMMFKVPSLRNVEKTGPYFHNGKITTLEQAITRMAEYQLGRQLSGKEVAAIVVWMKSLTGELPTDYIRHPELPKSTPATPKPDLGD
jgi:cytochrome c peroxidase